MKKTVMMTAVTLFCFQSILAQPWIRGGNGFGGPPILGTNVAQNLLIRTNGLQRVIVKGAGINPGFVGIGLAFVAPTQLLDVRGGNINVKTITNSFMINDQSVLWHKGGTANIFVGVGAGAAHPFSTNSFNTFVGNNAGTANTGGINNTYLGYKAGASSTGELANTYVGSDAGSNATAGSDENVFVGWQSGKNITGVHNTFAGNISGQNCIGSNNSFYGIGSGVLSNGSSNCFFGASAGSSANGANNVYMGAGSGPLLAGPNNVAVGFGSAASQTSGSRNTYVGAGSAAAVTTGAANTFIGANANSTIPTLNNGAAIGANAQVVANNNMILGDNNVNVGIGLSADPIPPSNKLEINVNSIATAVTPNAGTSPPSFGASGLRFRKMNTTTPTIPNPGAGVLTVDNNGDIIYASSAAGCCVGNPCAGPLNPLAGGWQVPLATFNYNFTSAPATALAQVNVGFPACPGLLPGRFNSQTDIHRFAGAFINNNGFTAGFQCVGVGGSATSTNTNAVGVRGQALSAPAINSAVGVDGGSNDPTSTAAFNIGVNGSASNGNVAIGGHFQVIPSATPSGTNVGMRANVLTSNNPAATNVGGIMTSTIGGTKTFGAVGGVNNGANTTASGIVALPAGINIGVYGYNPSAQFVPPIFSNAWAGYFDGNVKVNGSGLITNAPWVFSDKRFKENFKKLDKDILDKITKLNGYSYTFKRDEFKEQNFESGAHYGFVAQELKEVFPELVREDDKGYFSVCYEGVLPVLLEAIKAQQKQIDDKTSVNSDIQKQLNEQKKANEDLKTKMDKLEQMINSCCAANTNGSKQGNTQIVSLSDKNVIVLNQNVPNPFAESTVITYNIPTDFGKAQINFTDNSGKIIKTVDVIAKGEGRLNVFANDLTNGLYSYTLIVDGKIIDTKKMVKD